MRGASSSSSSGGGGLGELKSVTDWKEGRKEGMEPPPPPTQMWWISTVTGGDKKGSSVRCHFFTTKNGTFLKQTILYIIKTLEIFQSARESITV